VAETPLEAFAVTLIRPQTSAPRVERNFAEISLWRIQALKCLAAEVASAISVDSSA
jgi:hypothetical protein